MNSQEFTIADLTRILREAAGEADPHSGDILDADFHDLGYDSVALLETAARVEREYDVTLADSAITQARTPRELLAVVRAHLPLPSTT